MTGNVKEREKGNGREKESVIGKENESENYVNVNETETEKEKEIGNAKGKRPGSLRGKFLEKGKKKKRPRRGRRMRGEPGKKTQLIRNVSELGKRENVASSRSTRRRQKRRELRGMPAKEKQRDSKNFSKIMTMIEMMQNTIRVRNSHVVLKSELLKPKRIRATVVRRGRNFSVFEINCMLMLRTLILLLNLKG